MESVFVNTGESIEEIGLLEFRLLYQGQLLASGNNKTHPEAKHAIRKALHPQIRRLWKMNQSLRDLASRHGVRLHFLQNLTGATELDGMPPDEKVEYGLSLLGRSWSKFGFDLVPLVTPDDALRCSLDILILRPEEERFIYNQGDLDGQVKTIFDALRIPENPSEVARQYPSEDEKPLFCLLSDDKLITEVRVQSEQLLMLPDQREVQATDAFVVIHVRLNHKTPRTFDNYFG